VRYACTLFAESKEFVDKSFAEKRSALMSKVLIIQVGEKVPGVVRRTYKGATPVLFAVAKVKTTAFVDAIKDPEVTVVLIPVDITDLLRRYIRQVIRRERQGLASVVYTATEILGG
jgi:hypothetical protein